MKSIAKTIRKIRNGANLISDHLLFIGGYKVGIIISELKAVMSRVLRLKL